MSASPIPPVIKVGAILVRGAGAEILIIQPKPKSPGEEPLFVLPRGSRQYALQVHGVVEWHDARDAQTALDHQSRLEPFTRTLEREIHEEAGLAPADLARARVLELGTRDFASRSKGVYPIHWFVVTPDAAGEEAMMRTLPSDTLQVRWASPAQVRAMAANGEFSIGYLPIIDEALGLVAAQ